MHIVHKVVAAHHRSDTRIYCSLECREVDLVHRALIRIRAHVVAVEFLVIEGEMLHCRHNSLRLHTLDILDGCPGCKKRILTHILKVSAAERAAVYVDARTEEYVHSPCAGIITESHTHFIGHVLVPRSSSRHSASEKRTLGVVAYTLWAVSHPDERNAQTLHRTYIESVLRTAHIGTLLLKSHLAHQLCSPVPMLLSDRISDIISRLMRRTAGACQKRHADCY